ncbi:hypothetical protein F5141DRAFT_1213159 [Pisolithus sp. B1]|nr:hypothetical protein F5141DRAFT_1213159 [Pisolithus sp. B1]
MTPQLPADHCPYHKFFIGPMPEKMFSVADDVREAILDESGDAEDGTLSRAMDNHAFHFFVRQGGKLEDWNDDTRADIRTELLSTPHVGTGCSFEIGNVLGVNILEKHTPLVSSARTAQVPDQVAASSCAIKYCERACTNSGWSTSVLLPSASAPALALSEPSCAEISVLEIPVSRTEPSVTRGDRSGEAILSETFIERRDAHEAVRPRVHYPDDQDVDDPQLEGTPVPHDVLTPPGDELVESGADATSVAPRQSGVDEIVLRDRMLVRVSHIPLEGLPRNFDEIEHRYATKFQEEGWAEFLVVWRGPRVEIYDDYTLPGREFITGHKKLAFLIPLSSSRTNVSLYSFADLTFCVHCPSTVVHNGSSKARALFHNSKEGTNVFIFKNKSRTRAEDLALAFVAPSSLIDVPLGDAANIDEAYRVFSVKNIVETVLQSATSARGVPGIVFLDWNHIRQDLQSGKRLALVWRLEDQLEWIWQPTDVEGNDRRWLVLCGLSLKQGRKAPHLEIRTVDHRREFVRLPGGTKMEEPPGVEGYLDRIKTQGQRQRVYVSTHDGSLFALSPNDASPPVPPSTHLSHMVDGLTDVNQYGEVIFRNEIERGVTQIRSAYGVTDLWNIVSVRAVLREAQQGEQDSDPSIETDEGGVVGLAKARNPLTLRLRRSFEIVLVSGRVIRLEPQQAYSCRNCHEWIDKLQALITYWTRRHKEDAELEMDISDTINQRPRLTPRLPRCHNGSGSSTLREEPRDLEASLPSLTSLYRWCVLSDCRSVIKSGRVFMRRGFRGQYNLGVGVLDPLPCETELNAASSASARNQEEFNPNDPTPPKRYCDGLEADEPVEDILFMLWYRKPRTSSAGGQASGIPPPSAKFKTVIFKTRNKIERDAWCWALNCEIEKVVRRNREREQRLRETGALVNISHP